MADFPPPIPHPETAAEAHAGPYVDVIYFLGEMVQRQASDLHLVVGAPPMARVHGTLIPLADEALAPETCRDLILGVLTDSQRGRLEEEWELDFALAVDQLGRFRGNAHYSRGALEAAFRHIPSVIPELGTLGHRPQIHRICKLEQGLFLVTGITGSGKSTTLAAMIRQISSQKSGIIVTVEDPIEFLFENSLSLVKQREVGSDTRTFEEALRRALRQDPDVIMVSELRDRETISTAITAAETGHLVLGTLHTIDAPKAIDRLVDVFPADQQPQIVAQLANCLQGILSQRLIERADETGRVLATEIMMLNHAIRSCLRDRRYEQMIGLMEIGAKDGMHTIDECLVELLESGVITKEEALLNARDPNRVNAAKTKKKGMFG
jgi:twitching motility protein PilT